MPPKAATPHEGLGSSTAIGGVFGTAALDGPATVATPSRVAAATATARRTAIQTLTGSADPSPIPLAPSMPDDRSRADVTFVPSVPCGSPDSGGPTMSHMERVGVSELRRSASAILRRVAAGETVEVTDRGRPVAVLLKTMPSGLARLELEGLLRRAELDLLDLRRVPLQPGAEPPSRVVSEGRAD